MTQIVVSALGDVELFRADWRRLYDLQPHRSFFLSPAWSSAWLEGRLSGALHEVRGLIEGKLVLLGAVGVPAARLTPLIGARQAHLYEFGIDRLDTIYVEDNDFLIASGDSEEGLRERALAAIVDTLGAEEIVLRNSARPLAEAASRFAGKAGWRSTALRVQPTFAIDLRAMRAAGGGALDARSSALRAKIGRARRRYEERGPVILRVAQSDAERAEIWRTLADLHQQGWARRGETGAFANPDFISFHERLQKRSPEAAQLLDVQVAGRPIGCLYNFLHNGRVLNYQSGFRYEDDNQLTPGLLMHALAAQHYLEAGFDAYDLLAGDAEYKRRLGDETGQLSTIVLEKRGGMRAGLRSALKGVRRAMRPR